MTFGEIIEFYKGKKKHYCISDSFVKSGYQQKKGGYIDYAKKTYSKEVEPSQKWHFIEAYASKKDRDDKFYYGRLKCPELLLWMAEAAGVDIEKLSKQRRKPWMLLIKESYEQGMLLGRQLETQFLGIC
jgi:hypothetical protein